MYRLVADIEIKLFSMITEGLYNYYLRIEEDALSSFGVCCSEKLTKVLLPVAYLDTVLFIGWGLVDISLKVKAAESRSINYICFMFRVWSDIYSIKILQLYLRVKKLDGAALYWVDCWTLKHWVKRYACIAEREKLPIVKCLMLWLHIVYSGYDPARERECVWSKAQPIICSDPDYSIIFLALLEARLVREFWQDHIHTQFVLGRYYDIWWYIYVAHVVHFAHWEVWSRNLESWEFIVGS